MEVDVRSVPALVVLTIWLLVSVAPAVGAPQDSSAQLTRISGVVIDDRTEQPIGAVLVSVEGQATTAATDANGRFTLTAPRGRRTIMASVIGYALLRTDVDVTDAPLDMTIRLSE